MIRLYRKNELTFSLVFIGAYVLTFSVADAVSDSIGIYKVVTAPVGFAFSFILYIWLKKNGLTGKYGLSVPLRGELKYYDFIFILFLLSANLWNGINLNFTRAETAFYVLSMLFVGFIEEVIFRGFLFKALCRDNIKTAIIISSFTFGAGHIVNLLSGADFLLTLIQICHACIIGYIFTLFFIRTESLLLCIVTHSLFNALDAFSAGNLEGVLFLIFTGALLMVAIICTKLQWKDIIDK